MRKSSPESGISFCNIWYHADWFTFNKILSKFGAASWKNAANYFTKSRYFINSEAIFQILGDRNLANNVQI